jgi:hypothetical protein
MQLVLLLLAIAVQQPATTVSGVVTDSVTKSPVAAARVLLARVDGPLTESLLAIGDTGGRFQVTDVPAGSYRVFADRDDYLRGEHRGVVQVRSGQPVRDLAIVLTPTGVISGRVMNEHGEPASKIVVRALTESQVLSTFPKWVAEARTNDLGEYRLFSLPPGRYIVSAQRYPGPQIEGTNYRIPTPPCPDCRGEGTATIGLAGLLKTGAFIAPPALTGQVHPAVYFPGTTDLAAGQRIEVRPGAQVGGIDLTLIVKF